VGDDGGARSAVYRLWAQHPSKGKGDLYIGTRLLGEDFKVSLHSERGTLAPRGHLAISESTRQAVALNSRFLAEWPRKDPATLKGTAEFEILVPTSELHAASPPDEDTTGINWLAPAPIHGAVLVRVLNLGHAPNASAASLGVRAKCTMVCRIESSGLETLGSFRETWLLFGDLGQLLRVEVAPLKPLVVALDRQRGT